MLSVSRECRCSFATISGGVWTDVIIGRPLRRAVQPTTASSGRARLDSAAPCAQLRQSIAQTSALPSATATIEARCAPVSMCSEKMSEVFARRFQIARQRDDARHGIEAVVGEALAAHEIERDDGRGRRPGAATPLPAGISSASGSRWNRTRPARLRCRHSSAGRRRSHARRAPAPSAPSRSAQAAASDASTASGSRVRRAAGVAGSGAITLPCPSRMPPGTGGRSALRRTRLSGASMPARSKQAAKPRPFGVGVGARLGPVIHRQGGDEFAHRAIWRSGRRKCKRREGSFLRRLGRHRRGAEAATLRALTRGRNARPASGARCRTG